MIDKLPKAFTFDTGGTILDWHTGFKNGWQKVIEKYNFKIDKADLANLQRKKSLEIVTRQKESKLLNFDEAHKLSVEEICKERNLDISEEDKVFLHNIVPTKLRVWDDFLLSFNYLKNLTFCVSFTLLSNRLVYTNSKLNKVNWDLIISCETINVYKPNILAYLKTAKLLQFEPFECCMVACHSFDLNAAKKAGFKTIFVKRPYEWGPDTKIHVDGDYDLVVDSFDEIVNNFK